MSYETFEKALCTLPETAGRRFFIRHDFPLSRVTSFHIGGNADLAVYPADAEAFAYALDAVVQAGVPYTVIGNGSNTLVRDSGFRGVVFVTTDMRRVTIDGTRLTGGCGVLLGSGRGRGARAAGAGLVLRVGSVLTLGLGCARLAGMGRTLAVLGRLCGIFTFWLELFHRKPPNHRISGLIPACCSYRTPCQTVAIYVFFRAITLLCL